MTEITIRQGDCLTVMLAMIEAGETVDSVVCDPPYHLASIVNRFSADNAAPVIAKQTGVYARSSAGFMGQKWDGGDTAFNPETWSLAYHLLKPGGHLLAFSSSRTYHRLACAVEDAGFDIRDCIMWLYGSGFPKSHNVAKSIDRQLGAGTEHAEQWQGWGTALKPAVEPIVMARKPLDGTVAANMMEHGTGGLNIDACRIPTADSAVTVSRSRKPGQYLADGRWPANVAHDGSDEVAAAFAEYGAKGAGGAVSGNEPSSVTSGIYGQFNGRVPSTVRNDSGAASRFFYSAKADKQDRWGSKHPTVKPVNLMRWLVRMVTPPGGRVLDPFAGSGSTGVACLAEGFDATLIERESEYVADIRARINHHTGTGAHSANVKNRNESAEHSDLPLFGENRHE